MCLKYRGNADAWDTFIPLMEEATKIGWGKEDVYPTPADALSKVISEKPELLNLRQIYTSWIRYLT